MVISSSNTGNPGGMSELSQLSDQTAAANVLRASMGIVKNLDTIIFTDVDKKALWKYDTSSSKPTLHPLEHVRTDVAPSRIDDSWRLILQQLINDLPDDIRIAYEHNLLLPFGERNASLNALGRLLEGTAKTLNWIQNSVKALDPSNPAAGPGSEIEARRSMYMGLIETVTAGLRANSETVFQSLKRELLKIGANDPHFDDLTGTLNQIGAAYSAFLNLDDRPTERGLKHEG